MDTVIINLMKYVMTFIWEHGSALIALFAAWATWRAAVQAAKSAKIAREAMQKSEVYAAENLAETREFNRRSSFENRFALLLAQHDQYHRQVCNYIDENKHFHRPDEVNSVTHFFEVDFYATSLKPSLAFLTGHEIISRYMRTLYHLLKYVDENLYESVNIDQLKQKKYYTSPVRSTIRNDVLCLIAVNALNISQSSDSKSGYGHYQWLLHKFDFFEHAVFPFPFEPNSTFIVDDAVNKIREVVMVKQSHYMETLRDNRNRKIFQHPKITIISPLILCLLIYKNPMRDTAYNALHTLFESINYVLTLQLESFYKAWQESNQYIFQLEQGEYSNDTGPFKPMNQAMIAEIKQNVISGKSYRFERYIFRRNGQIQEESGEDLISCIETVLCYEKLISEIKLHGDIQTYIAFLAKNLEVLLDEVQPTIDMYNITIQQKDLTSRPMPLS